MRLSGNVEGSKGWIVQVCKLEDIRQDNDVLLSDERSLAWVLLIPRIDRSVSSSKNKMSNKATSSYKTGMKRIICILE